MTLRVSPLTRRVDSLSTRGRYTRTVVPTSGTLTMAMPPLNCRAIAYTVASPSPWCRPSSCVVKNGSKARATVSALMPSPVSEIASSTYSPGRMRASPTAVSRSSSTGVDSMVSVPPWGMASQAFSAR